MRKPNIFCSSKAVQDPFPMLTGRFERQYIPMVYFYIVQMYHLSVILFHVRWARAARSACESRLSSLSISFTTDAGCGGSAATKHLPGQKCHHLANVCLLSVFIL